MQNINRIRGVRGVQRKEKVSKIVPRRGLVAQQSGLVSQVSSPSAAAASYVKWATTPASRSACMHAADIMDRFWAHQCFGGTHGGGRTGPRVSHVDFLRPSGHARPPDSAKRTGNATDCLLVRLVDCVPLCFTPSSLPHPLVLGAAASPCALCASHVMQRRRPHTAETVIFGCCHVKLARSSFFGMTANAAAVFTGAHTSWEQGRSPTQPRGEDAYRARVDPPA